MAALSMAVLIRLGATLLPLKNPKILFKLSNDCENLFGDSCLYEFAGFTESKKSLCNAYKKINNSIIGKKIGYVCGDVKLPVYNLDVDGGDFVLVRGKQDSWDIFRRVS